MIINKRRIVLDMAGGHGSTTDIIIGPIHEECLYRELAWGSTKSGHMRARTEGDLTKCGYLHDYELEFLLKTIPNITENVMVL